MIGLVVGSTELESVTSCVSSRRSNQLSYEPPKTESNDSKTGVHLESRFATVALLEPKWSPNPITVSL